MSQSALRLIVFDKQLHINLSFQLTDTLSYSEIFHQLQLRYPEAINEAKDIRFSYNIDFRNEPTEILIKNHVGFEYLKQLCKSQAIFTLQQDYIQLTPHLRQKFDQLSKTKDGLVIICI